MTPAATLLGSVKALTARPDWSDYFDISKRGLKASFVALLLTIPAFYLIAHGVQVERMKQFGESLQSVPLTPFIILLTLYLLTFSACACIFSMLFDTQDRFRPWVITRHWTVFWLTLLIASLFGLYLLGLLPFDLVNYAALAGFLGILLIDIRLGQIIVPFKIGKSILIACVINAMGLIVILLGFEQIL